MREQLFSHLMSAKMGKFVVTEEFLASGISDVGGYSRVQASILGVKWPLRPGWKDRVIGMRIAIADAEAFVRLKGTAVRKMMRTDGRNENWWVYDQIRQRWVYSKRQARASESLSRHFST